MGRLIVNFFEFLLAGITLHFILPTMIDTWDFNINFNGKTALKAIQRQLKELQTRPSRNVAMNLPDSGMALAVVQSAALFLDTPYVYGGTSQSGVDCSGLIFAAYKNVGISLRRVAADQYKYGKIVPSMSQLAAGDLIFFQESWASKPTHVGLCIGSNKMIHASSKLKRVVIRNYDISYYRKRFIGGRRILGR